MTREEAINAIKEHIDTYPIIVEIEALEMAIEALEHEECEDAVSRKAVKSILGNRFIELQKRHDDKRYETNYCLNTILELPPVTRLPKTGHCKDCKWWKDSDGAFRRGIGAESRCPINREEVYEGNGYCFLFEPQESEGKE